MKRKYILLVFILFYCVSGIENSGETRLVCVTRCVSSWAILNRVALYHQVKKMKEYMCFLSQEWLTCCGSTLYLLCVFTCPADILNGIRSKLSTYSIVNPQVIHRWTRSTDKHLKEVGDNSDQTLFLAESDNIKCLTCLVLTHCSKVERRYHMSST